MADDDVVRRAYLAGTFDAKGWIGMTVQPRAYRLFVQLTQPVRFHDILDRVGEEFGGSVVYQYRVAAWRTSKSAECRLLLEAVLPHLIAKRERAELALAYLELVAGQVRPALPRIKHGQWTGRTRLSTAELAERHAFYERMLQLNKVGN